MSEKEILEQDQKPKQDQTEVQILDKHDKPIPDKKRKEKKKNKNLKNALFTIIWLYFLSRLIITDFDLLVANHYLHINPILYSSLRILFISLFILVVWMRIGNKRFWKNFGLFLLFPIYPGLYNVLKTLLWTIPSKLIKHKKTATLYNYIEWYFDFFFHFKRKMAIGIIFLLSFISLYSLGSQLMVIPIILFSFLQISHLRRRYNETYEPIKIFQLKLELSDPERDENLSKEKLKEQFDKITEDAKKREEEGKTEFLEMEHLLLMSEFSHVFNAKIRDILNKRSYLKSFIWKAIYSFLISMVFFGGINYALYIMDSNNFEIEYSPGYFDFFYYSFFTIIPDGTDIEPITMVAKSIRMTGVIIGVFINLLVLAVYFSVSSDRYKENLEKVVRYTDIYSDEIKKHFKEKYGKDPSDGLKQLKIASSALKSINAIRNVFNVPKK
jgi:ABC-type multidrug transport system fused ATPase/permease subunit